ncbi:glycosyltransferase [Catenovulum maritimum]|uniref:Glycosyl transferase n=1 Tax=Catenovulum maritimum TaxID=1513271 RepID=A0A0J8H0U7_9ALTE|nr:glycosyltransferase [Catenovulum maritimum]KMT66638.1 glycosyl transferase [Catenovulum maritimum]
MKLSVIVPVYNLEQFIGQCLESLVNQEVNFKYEIIVCDDASTDNSANIIQEYENIYPSLIKSVLKKSNQGLAENIRTLLTLAEGSYIAYMDGDDLALPGKLQTQVNYLDSHSTCSMVYHESDMFDSETNQSIRPYSDSFYNNKHIPQSANVNHLILYGTFLQASSVMFRRHDHLLDTVPDFCKIILDYPFYILNAGYLKGSIDFIETVLGRYRIHNQSFGAQTARSVERRMQSLADICEACVRARETFGIEEEIITRGINHHKFAAALYFLRRGKHELFLELIEDSVADGKFFDERHFTAYEQRKNPDKLKQELQL